MSKIHGSYGANNVSSQSETKKDKVSTGKSFGNFYIGDQEEDLDPQAQSQEEDLGGISDDLGYIFGNFGSSRDNYDSDNRSNTSRPRTNPRTNTKEVEKEDQKATNKPKHKAEFEKFSQFGEQEEPEKLKEVTKTDPLAPFQIPAMQVDRVFTPAPVQTAPLVPPQMVEQIVQDVRLGVNEMGVAEFQFDLKSDALDGLKLKISTKDGQVYATFIAENVHVKDTIDQGAQELVKALQDRGLQVANLQVSIGADSSSSGGQGGFSQGQGNQGQSDQQNQRYRGYTYADSSSSNSDSSADISTTNTDYTV
jgi:flagellar hook-length control protein FliK